MPNKNYTRDVETFWYSRPLWSWCLEKSSCICQISVLITLWEFSRGCFQRAIVCLTVIKVHKRCWTISNWGMKKIHAFVNNFKLFSKLNKELDKCHVSSKPRYKMTSQNRTTKIPQKVLHYLPLKPRWHNRDLPKTQRMIEHGILA